MTFLLRSEDQGHFYLLSALTLSAITGAILSFPSFALTFMYLVLLIFYLFALAREFTYLYLAHKDNQDAHS